MQSDLHPDFVKSLNITIMKKRIFLFIFVLSSTLTVSAYDAKINGIYYNLITKAKQAEVTSGDTQYTGKVTIPTTIMYNDVTYSVTSIGEYAFERCSNLKSITIGSSVTSIGDRAFFDCYGLTSIEIPNGVLSIGGSAFLGCSGLTIVTIGNSVTSIGDNAFSGCKDLTSVTIGNSVIEIGTSVFSGCSSLTSITIPNSVTSIGGSAFSGCSGLTSITIPNSVTSIGGSAFSSCSSLSSVTMGNSVTSIGGWTFYGCSSLTSVTISNSVTSIEDRVFYGCSNLTSVTIPNSVTSIGYEAFRGCSSLTSVTVPNSVISIGGGVFYGCSGLTSVTIGSCVNTIHSSAFQNCAKLNDVYCYAENVPETESDVFKDSYIEYVTLYVPKTSINAYKTTAPWSGFGTIKALSGDIPETPKCATPTIAFVDGKIVFDCETVGVEYAYEVKCTDAIKGYGETVPLTTKYTISVCATKSGYEDSDVATKEIIVGGTIGIKGDVNEDGTVNGTDIQEVINIIVNAE